jgi:hypothetical protein
MRVKYLYERRFGWTMNSQNIFYLSLKKKLFNINYTNSTKLDSYICVKNNGHNIPALCKTLCSNKASYQVEIQYCKEKKVRHFTKLP